MRRFLPLLFLAATACTMTNPEPAVPVDDWVPPADVTSGFNEREPDTCKASTLQAGVGQPVAMLDTSGAPGPVRIIAQDEVVDQEEYRSARINLHVDRRGTVRLLTCG